MFRRLLLIFLLATPCLAQTNYNLFLHQNGTWELIPCLNCNFGNTNSSGGTGLVYFAGHGLLLNSGTFSIDPTIVLLNGDSTVNGQPILNGGNILIQTGLVYSAGNGLQLSGSQFAVNPSVVTTNGGFSIIQTNGGVFVTNTVANGNSVIIQQGPGGPGGAGGGMTNFAAYGTPVQLQSITNSVTTNLVDFSSNPFHVVLYFDKACTVVVEADLNYVVHSSGGAAGGIIAIAAGPNTVNPIKFNDVPDYQGTISTSGSLDSHNSPLTLRSFYSFGNAGTCEFHVTGQINSPGTLSFNGAGFIYAQQIGP